MRTVAAILAGLAKATSGLSTWPATEGILDVPPTLAITTKAPLEYLGVASSTSVPLRSSGGNFNNIQVANGAAVASQTLTLGPGLWHLYITADYSSNYDATAIVSAGVRLQDPDTLNPLYLLAFSAPGTALSRVWGSFSGDLVLAKFNSIETFLSANGVGNSHRIVMTIFAEKLL